jgi:hypothetical protein
VLGVAHHLASWMGRASPTRIATSAAAIASPMLANAPGSRDRRPTDDHQRGTVLGRHVDDALGRQSWTGGRG